jgi:hypothetical protein
MRLTAPSIVRRFMNLPAHYSESRATGASSSQLRGFPPERLTKRNGSTRAELIDGARLAELLIRHRVGVQTVHTVDLYRLDEDFFDKL